MQTLDIVAEPLISIRQLKSLVDVPGPCVSIYVSGFSVGNSPSLLNTRLLAMLGNAQQEIRSQRAGPGLLELPKESIGHSVVRAYRVKHRGSFAVFLSHTTSRILWTAQPLTELMRIDDVFYLRPLVSLLASVRDFGVLALSQKHVRLFRCTDADQVIVRLPHAVPQCVEEAMGMDVPDHTLENRSASGNTEGTRRGIHFTTDSGDKKLDSYLLRFFSILDEQINRFLRPEQIPLVLLAAERELALYRKVNTYPLLIDESVHGSPEWLSDAQLHKLALQAVDRERAEVDNRIASQFSEKTAGALLERDPESILTAAGSGNVRAVLLPETVQDTLSEDLLNLIVVQTLRKGGEVLTAAHSLPAGEMAVAQLRHAR